MDSNDIKIVHAIPGRVRLKVAKLKHNDAFARQVEERLNPLAAITSVETNPLTGTVLVVYDLQAVTVSATAHELLDTITQLFPELDLKKYQPWLARLGLDA